MTITNSLGQVVYTFDELTSKELKVSTTDWPHGIYFIRFNSHSHKFIKL